MTQQQLQHFQPVPTPATKWVNHNTMFRHYQYRNLIIVNVYRKDWRWGQETNFFQVLEYPSLAVGSLKAAANAIDAFLKRKMPIAA